MKFNLIHLFQVILLIILSTPICLFSSESILLDSTVRIKYERFENNILITGHGTAFGVDISKYGFVGNNYLLSAAHNVLNNKDQPYENLKAEINNVWTCCKVVVFDKNLDLCIIKVDTKLSSILQLADVDLSIGSDLIMAGSPRGTCITLFYGTLIEKFSSSSIRWKMGIPFDLGNSGGPVICLKTLKVVGVVVAGVPKNGDIDREFGLYIPVMIIRSFLEDNRRN